MSDIDECSCCSEYKKRIQQLEKQLKILKNKKQSTNSPPTSDTDEGVLDLSERRVEELIERNYTEELFNQGYKGVISFIYSFIVRDDDDRSKILYRCVDQTKKLFQFQDDEGVKRDVRCKVLLDVVLEPLFKKVNKIYRTAINRIYEDEKDPEVSSDDEFDSDIENDDINEVIVSELHFDSGSSVDDRVNTVVARFSEIKKCGKNRKPIIDELSQMLYF